MNRSSCADHVGKGVFLAEGINVKRQRGLHVHEKVWWVLGRMSRRETQVEVGQHQGLVFFMNEP